MKAIVIAREATDPEDDAARFGRAAFGLAGAFGFGRGFGFTGFGLGLDVARGLLAAVRALRLWAPPVRFLEPGLAAAGRLAERLRPEGDEAREEAIRLLFANAASS